MKRSASFSSNEEPPVKKQKVENDPLEVHDGINVAATPPAQTTTVGLKSTAGDETHENKGESSLDDVQVDRQKEKISRKAGEGFTAWKPKPAYVPIPPVQTHWGIVPRSGAHRPTEVQPPARDSDAAVRPALWEDRKGAVRVKRGSRYIDGYDQAFHMWLPLMDLRPTSKKNQAPKRIAVGYYYRHGMPTDWNDPGPLNDLNKALQNAIKDRAYEKPWTNPERNALTQLLAADPQASIWDIAERFNDQMYPMGQDDEENQYPTGRFIEGIRHEYLTYKSTYDRGEAPTDRTSTDIPLEVIWAARKAAAPKKTATSGTKKASTKSVTAKMSDTAGVTKKKRASKKQSKKSDAMIVESDDEAQQPQQQPSVSMSQQPRLSEDHEIMLEVAGAYDPDDVRPSSPLSPHTHAMVTSPSYGSTTTATMPDEHVNVSQTAASREKSCANSISPGSPPVKESSFVATDMAHVSADIRVTQESTVEQTQQIHNAPSKAQKQVPDLLIGQATETSIIATTAFQKEAIQPVAAAVEVPDVPQPTASVVDANVSEFVGNAVREVQVDENYDDDDGDDELDSLFNE